MSKTNGRRGFLKPWGITLAILMLIVFGGVVTIRSWYAKSLKPLSSSTMTSDFTVSGGSSVRKISHDLSKAHLIRSSKAFETYVRSNLFNGKLQAGTYTLSPSMSVAQIVTKMRNGDVSKNLLTILPGKRLDEIEQAFKKAGYSQTEIDSAFNPVTYAGHPALASLPKGASLEGYLFPDSFQKQSDTPASVIVRESLDEMQSHLTTDITNGFAQQGLNVFQGVTLASIVAKESSDPAAQPTVAQVFLTRLKTGMMLGSDVTAFYASAIAGQPKNVTIESPYNTRIHTGLPPGPIGNITANSLKAVAHPAGTDYLFFVAGDDGVIHFSHTDVEHQKAIAQYCQRGCGG
jgi:UPF0755 protein